MRSSVGSNRTCADHQPGTRVARRVSHPHASTAAAPTAHEISRHAPRPDFAGADAIEVAGARGSSPRIRSADGAILDTSETRMRFCHDDR
jgi:hypothetical protein